MSDLARYSNNHFGIKCHRNWRGRPYMLPMMVPMIVSESIKQWKTHTGITQSFWRMEVVTKFCLIFRLPITKGGRGLQTTGYATDKAYANKLIKLIEDYELYRFDDKNYRKKYKEGSKSLAHEGWKHQPYKTHGLVYVIAVEGDTYASIAEELDSRKKIY